MNVLIKRWLARKSIQNEQPVLKVSLCAFIIKAGNVLKTITIHAYCEI